MLLPRTVNDLSTVRVVIYIFRVQQGVPKHYLLECDAVLTYVITTMFLRNVGEAFIVLHRVTYQQTVFCTATATRIKEISWCSCP
jgi:hypothetical protein